MDEFDLFAVKSKKANKANSSICLLGESMARQSAFEINGPFRTERLNYVWPNKSRVTLEVPGPRPTIQSSGNSFTHSFCAMYVCVLMKGAIKKELINRRFFRRSNNLFPRSPSLLMAHWLMRSNSSLVPSIISIQAFSFKKNTKHQKEAPFLRTKLS